MNKPVINNIRILLIPLICTWIAAIAPSGALAQQLDSDLSVAAALHAEALKAAGSGNFTQAVSLMEKAIRKSGDNSQYNFDHVVMLSWAGKAPDAIEKFEKLRLNHTIPDYVLPEIASAYRQIGEYDKSILGYKEYLSRHPGDRTAIQNIVSCYLDTGRSEEALRFIDQATQESPQSVRLKQLHADVLFQKNDINGALELYAEAFRDTPEDEHAYIQIGIVRALIAQGRGKDVVQCIDGILAKDPRNYAALICKGELLEIEENYIAAYRHYEYVLTLFPHSVVVKGLKYRSLIRLGCTSLVRELLKTEKTEVDDALKIILSGDEVVARIHWDEPLAAGKIGAYTALEIGELQDKNPDRPYVRDALLRNYYDRLESRREQESMWDVVREYKMLEAIGIAIPPWTLVYTADAYLYLQQPEQALKLYYQALEQQWDPSGSTRMSIYNTLMELGKYKQADAELVRLDNDTPTQSTLQGIWSNNWIQEDITVTRGWSYLYQDRLAEAYVYLRDYLSRAPANTHIRTALAQTYLWRGWPRLALEEFQISNTIDEQDITTLIGRAYALDENDQGGEARRQAKELIALSPTNKNIQRLNRHFEIQDMSLLTINAECSAEQPDSDGLTWSVRVDQPLFPWRSIFAEYVWRRNQEEERNALIRRFLVGTDWRLGRDWWFKGGLSFDYDGSDNGHFESLTLTPDDYWTFSAGYDSYIIDLPLSAAASGVSAKEYSGEAQFRASESFIAQARFASRSFSDDNRQTSYVGSLDTAITTAAYWKTRLAIEGYSETNTNTEVDYFSPGHLYSIYLVPMAEHTWFRRYEQALVDRLYVGLGAQNQKYYGWNEVWYIRYELDNRLSDLWNILVGTTYAQKNYDGEDADAWTIYLTIKRHF